MNLAALRPNRLLAALLLGLFAVGAQADGITNPGGGSSTASGVTVGTSVITGGTNTRVLFDDAGMLGESAAFTFTKATGALNTTTLALGGATIGTNALAVTGNASITGTMSTSGSISVLADSGAYFLGVNADLALQRDAAYILALRYGANAQALRVYNSRSDASNGEWFDVDWRTNANVATIGTNNNGTGVARNLRVNIGGVNKLDYGVTVAGAWATAATFQSGQLIVSGLASDAAHTDSTVCQDTSTHQFYAGSGTLGICLGTSGRQFKTDFAPMTAGLSEIMRLPLQSYRYLPGFGDDGAKRQYGLVAQDVEQVLPELAGKNDNGETINYDAGALLFIALKSIQELKAEIDSLKQAQRAAR